jgi:DNA-binding NarL/FixJ family response regulator
MFENITALLSNPNIPDTMSKDEEHGNKLTKRESEVLSLLAKGMTRDEIANKLYISSETVKMHTKNLYKKLKVKNKVEALIKSKMI